MRIGHNVDFSCKRTDLLGKVEKNHSREPSISAAAGACMYTEITRRRIFKKNNPVAREIYDFHKVDDVTGDKFNFSTIRLV